MLELLQALAAEPAVQQATASPIVVVNTAFIVSNIQPPFQGNIRVVVKNAGTDPDELVAVTTPLGETLELRRDGNIFSNAEPVALPIILQPPVGGKPSDLPLVIRVKGLETGDYWSSGTSITLHFAHAGEITVPLQQAVPVAPMRRERR